MIIGMIVAVDEEIDAMLNKMGEPSQSIADSGYELRKYSIEPHELYVIRSGAGQVYAAAATQLLISKYEAEIIVNFGICGALTEKMSLCRCCVVEKVVHYNFDTSAVDGWEAGRHEEYPDVYIPADAGLVALALKSEPSLTPVICASGDKFIADPKEKKELSLKYGADICEMEAAGILLTANRSKTPALLIKAVSDSVDGGAEEYEKMAYEAAGLCIRTALGAIEKITKNQ